MLTIPNCKNKKLIEGILKLLSRREKFKIAQTATRILRGKITITDAEYRRFSRDKHFLRNLSVRNISYNKIINNYKTFQEVLNIMLKKKTNKNGSRSESNLSSLRRMGKNDQRDQSPTRRYESRNTPQVEEEEESRTETETDSYSENSSESKDDESEKSEYEQGHEKEIKSGSI